MHVARWILSKPRKKLRIKCCLCILKHQCFRFFATGQLLRELGSCLYKPPRQLDPVSDWHLAYTSQHHASADAVIRGIWWSRLWLQHISGLMSGASQKPDCRGSDVLLRYFARKWTPLQQCCTIRYDTIRCATVVRVRSIASSISATFFWQPFVFILL